MSKFEEYKKERMLAFRQNKYISNFIETNNFDNSFVYDHFSIFDSCLSSLELCKNCKGLENCAQRSKGEIKLLVNDGVLDNSLCKCKLYEDRFNMNKMLSSFVYSNISSMYALVNMSNIEFEEDTLKALFVKLYEIYKGENNKGYYIYGDMGIGKTYLCYALANSLVKDNKSVAFIKTNDFVTNMASLVVSDLYEYNNLVNRISKADYVFIDDIGSESVSEFSRDRLLFNILDYRMENKLCTIFTSNLDKEALLKHYAHAQDNGVNSKRILERIDVLSDNYCLIGKDKRRIKC